MNTQKILTLFTLTIILALLATACGKETATEPPVASATSQPVAPSTQAPAGPAAVTEFGFITGRVHGQAPPTPPMVVYAVDNTTGSWSFIETQHTDGEAPFTLQVPPGSYQVFAFSDTGPFAGYSQDGRTLTTVTVAAGQTVANIIVRPPSQSECGSMFGLPASPDGRFAAIEGPSQECEAAVQSARQGDLQPLRADECRDLADAMTQTLAVGVETTDTFIERSWREQQGTACQLTAIGNGLNFDDIMVAQVAVKAILETRGWVEETQAPMCLGKGGWGPGASTSCFTQADRICEAFVYVEPLEDALCPGNEPISACLDRLAPEQRIYTVILTCAQGDAAQAVPLPKTEPARIQFAAGATSAQVLGSLFPGELHPYVLNATAGQEMTVNLYASSGGVPAPGSAILVIWGLDGTVLISDHADATTWQGVLPLTQDYYIDVQAVSQTPVDYTLEVIIPPATDPTAGFGLPRVVPPEFEPYLQALVLSGVPPMLPPEFPVAEGLPPIYPYIYTADEGEYELSLDFGQDCRGTGACHYGSLTGKKVDSTVPVGTRNNPFEAERAQKVTLACGIQGYFVESLCGANCSDAQVFWIVNGYQYMLGVKAGTQPDVINLANATIQNSKTTTECQGGPQPLDPAACSDLANALAGALGIPATMVEAPFEDRVSGQTGTGCQVTASGTGLDFENIIVVGDALVQVLQARGWGEDQRYLGGGPGAILTGYRQADALCLLLAYWEPSEDADCPTDQPIFTCEMPPEQKLYTITLNCAQGTSTGPPQGTAPAVVALADGTQCTFAGAGATLAFDGKRLNYTCPAAGEDQVGLLGDLLQGDGVLTAEKVVIGHDENGFFIKSSEMVTIHVVQQ